MSRAPSSLVRPIVASAFWVLALGGVATFLGGRPRQVSVDLWLVAIAVWAAWVALGRIEREAPTVDDQLRGLWRLHRPEPVCGADERPRQVVLLEGLLLSARDNERAAALRLRPRLRRLATHVLRREQGIDLATEPERAADVLGPAAWLVDDSARDRPPALDELEDLVDALVDGGDAR
ncbi:MAG: hypothetical protein ACFCVK_24565 [Acidimicrobiales bacterium]